MSSTDISIDICLSRVYNIVGILIIPTILLQMRCVKMQIFKLDAIEVCIKDYFIPNPNSSQQMSVHSDYFLDLRTIFFKFFEQVNKALGHNLDVDASATFTFYDLFTNHGVDQELCWRNSPNKINLDNHKSIVQFKQVMRAWNVDSCFCPPDSEARPRNYDLLNCSCWFIIDSDRKYTAVEIMNALSLGKRAIVVDMSKEDLKNKGVASYLHSRNEHKKPICYYTFFHIATSSNLTEECGLNLNEFANLKSNCMIFCFHREISSAVAARNYHQLQHSSFTTNGRADIEKKTVGFEQIVDPNLKKDIGSFIEQFKIISENSYPCIITFEGLAGSGRSTLAKEIATTLQMEFFHKRVLRYNDRKPVYQPPYLESDACMPLSPVGDCVVFINHAEDYIDSFLRNSFIRFAKACDRRCLIILSTSTQEMEELLRISSALRGMISKRFVFKNYTIDDEIVILKWILVNVHHCQMIFDDDTQKMLKNLMQTAAHCSEIEGNSDVDVGERLANGYFAARLAEFIASECYKQTGCYYINSTIIESVCQLLLKEYENTGVILTS